MLQSPKVIIGTALLAAAGITAYAFSNASQRIDPSTLHPQRSIVFAQWDGSEQHQAAIKETAQHKAVVESGLFDYGVRLMEQATQPLVSQLEPGTSDADFARIEEAKTTFQSLYKHGFSLSVTDGADRLSPMATLVVHGAAGGESNIPPLLKLADIRDEPDQKEVRGRTINFLRNPSNPAIEIVWFSEQQHLVVAIGESPAERVIAVAEGEMSNVTDSDLWKQCRGDDVDFEVAAAAWFDLKSLRDRFGAMPVPIPDLQRQVSVNELSELLGIDNLNAMGGQFGYRGAAPIGRTFINAPGKREGLLSLLDQPLFSLDDLPPLPQDSLAFGAFSLDSDAALETTLAVVRSVVALLPPDAGEQLEGMLQSVPQLLGFNLQQDLLASLGDVHCVYSDPAGGPFGIGFGAAIAVKDADKLNRVLDVLVGRSEQLLADAPTPVPMTVQRATVDGHEMLTLPAGVFTPTVAVGEKWVVLGLFPQTVRSFFLREEGKLPAWEPSAEHNASLAELPKQFSAISVDDPRQGLKLLYSFVPILNSAVHTMAPGLGANAVKAAELPPQEIVMAPLFPNVNMSVPTENGIVYHSRHSLPLTLPAAEGVFVAPTLVALLLPAVQQAREAARRTTSSNNLRNIGLAIHNYEAVHQHLPIGTQPNTDLKPEQRLSFLFALLPYLEQQALYEILAENKTKAWDDPAVADFTNMLVPTYLNPGLIDDDAPGATHYVGMAGVGADAPELPVHHERAGMFGYDRKTRLRDVTDGLSNTVMMTETNIAETRWAAGGQTLKSLTQEPYINGIDGIGGPSPGGCQMLLGDGSVRFVSESVDPEVMRRMSTMAGGKPVGDF